MSWRRGFSSRRAGATALARLWTLPPGMAPRTVVAAFRDGWAWFAAPGDGRAMVQLVLASGRGRMPSRRVLSRHYEERLRAVAEAGSWLEGATAKGTVGAREATPVMTAPLLGADMLRVGDAAFAIDPLSGHGVYAALGGALAAVAVINTLCKRPEAADAAQSLYLERGAQSFVRHGRIGRDFYARERRWPEHPFWSERRHWPDDEAAHPAPDAAPPEIAERPVIEDGFVVRREVITTADLPRGVWQVDGVALVPLLALAQAMAPAASAEIARRAAAEMGRRPEQVATALDWLRYRGLVR